MENSSSRFCGVRLIVQLLQPGSDADHQDCWYRNHHSHNVAFVVCGHCLAKGEQETAIGRNRLQVHCPTKAHGINVGAIFRLHQHTEKVDTRSSCNHQNEGHSRKQQTGQRPQPDCGQETAQYGRKNEQRLGGFEGKRQDAERRARTKCTVQERLPGQARFSQPRRSTEIRIGKGKTRPGTISASGGIEIVGIAAMHSDEK
mmetsp:Transcript_1192/g.2412  ORF Transcript_1192/g.2412 Transcript_1192/m.2412 type:complete len:201 (+) Transcript_1192:206-808(+)